MFGSLRAQTLQVRCQAQNGDNTTRVEVQKTRAPKLASKGIESAGVSYGSVGYNGLSRGQPSQPTSSQAPEMVSRAAHVTEERPTTRVSKPAELARTVRAVILAGGETSNPLTRHRAMPAVPMGSSLHLVDIPINNCLKAGINKIYVLTQYQSASLNSHIAASYPPVKFGGPDSVGWVDVLAAQQTVLEKEWYTGSADAIRKNLGDLKDEWNGITPAEDYVILSGSAVYNMDFAQMISFHRERGADITMCTHLVDEAAATSKGIARVHSSGRILKFEERPSANSLASLRQSEHNGNADGEFLANMGIYIFKREALFRLLDPAKKSAITHIGHHVIPNALAQEMKVYSYQYDGYWHDVSTLRDYYQVNLDMAAIDSPIRMHAMEGSIISKGSQLPPAICQGEVSVENAILDDGSVLVDCVVNNAVVGKNIYIGANSLVEDSVLMGSPIWTSEVMRAAAEGKGERVYGVGKDCVLKGVVVDENATIGDGCKITNVKGVKEADRAKSEGYMIQDGLVVIMRGAVIPPGTVI